MEEVMSIRKPNETEEEYFARLEAEKKKKLQEELKIKKELEEKEKLKQLHWMRCPKCGMELKEIIFKGIHIDRCTSCNGVWLDNGELEQLAGAESSFISEVLRFFTSKK